MGNESENEVKRYSLVLCLPFFNFSGNWAASQSEKLNSIYRHKNLPSTLDYLLAAKIQPIIAKPFAGDSSTLVDPEVESCLK